MMTCRERALSDEYVDVLTDFVFTPDLFRGQEVDMCTIPAGNGMYVSYLKRSQILPLFEDPNAHYFVPQCLGLMADGQGAGRSDFDVFALTDTGIRQTQLPPLQLTGKGVVMGFLDTGDGVAVLHRDVRLGNEFKE